MKAALFQGYNTPLKVKQVEKPLLQPGFASVKVKATGICGGDLHRYSGGILVDPLPSIIGHQVAGIVEETGAGTNSEWLGKRVGVCAFTSCGQCRNCLRGKPNLCSSQNKWSIVPGFYGGMAEYVCVPETALVELPDCIPYEEAVCLVDAAATVYHCIQLCQIQLGDTAVVFGGGGDLGSSAVQFAKLCGANVIAVDITDEKLEIARKLGACELINARAEDPVKKVLELTDGRGAEHVFEVVGNRNVFLQALDCAATGGNIAILGSTDEPINGFITMPYAGRGFAMMLEKTLRGASGFSIEDIRACVSLRKKGLFNTRLGLSVISLDDVNEGFQGKMSGKYSRLAMIP